MKSKQLNVTLASSYLLMASFGVVVLILLAGCTAINSHPVASFICNPSYGEAPLTVSFNASNSYDPDGTIITYSWSFGDGRSGSAVTTSHTYTSAGTYTAKLIVTDNGGSTNTASRSITVVASPPEPTATFEITSWAQDYYEYSEEYSSFVYVYYKVTNTGSLDIDYYEVWFEVTCADGSKYQEWTNDINVAVGTYTTDYTLINTAKKRAVSVSISRHELTSYPW